MNTPKRHTNRSPNDLPVHELAKEIIEAFSESGRVVLEAPTGSGKTTQVPQILLDSGIAGRGQIAVLQPRRIAARLLASRVAAERCCRLGDEVGYQIRFDNVSSRNTRIKYVTEGILLRMMLDDPSLPGISTLIFDEFHERHLYGDITLARALQIAATERPDLRIGVMSATLNVSQLEKYLSPCRVLSSRGRTFPVDVSYLERASDADNIAPWDLAAREVERLLGNGAEGDVLVFMPGAYEIHRSMAAIQATREGRQCAFLPLHGELPPSEQDAAVLPRKQRKIIVATNVAETSLTIEGIRIVIDSGLARISRFDPYRGINTLLVENISQASADQRAGRAGRTAPGICVRLWSERQHSLRPPQEEPEIQRLDISEVLLTLKASGVIDARSFPWLDAPEPRSLESAEGLLRDLGAADSTTGEITGIGRRMLAFPTHPRFSRMLIAAAEHRCVRAISLAAAITQSRNLLVHRAAPGTEAKRDDILGEEKESDFFLLMRAWQYAANNSFSVDACRQAGIHAQAAREVGRTWQQLIAIARLHHLITDEDENPSSDDFRKCLLAGFSDHVGIVSGTGSLRCLLTGGRRGTISRESSVRNARLVVATEVKEIGTRQKEVTVLLSNVSAIEEQWLAELFPSDYSKQRGIVFDTGQKRTSVREQTLFRDLVLDSRLRGDAKPEEASPVLAEQILTKQITLKHWNHAVDQWIARVNSVSLWMPELGIPNLDEDACRHLLEQICYGAIGAKEIKERPVLPTFKDWLSPAQQNLIQELAPEQILLPGGRKPKLFYENGSPPKISTRLQDLYGVTENITICAGRVKVLIEILAPNQRPIQLTTDMANFWNDSYPAIKKQLQGRYPKHEWR